MEVGLYKHAPTSCEWPCVSAPTLTYVNRNIIGAVVSTQPFGGSGLSGTARRPAARAACAASRWSRW